MLLKINSILILLMLILIPTLTFLFIQSIIKEFNFNKIKDKLFMDLNERLEETNLGYFNRIRIEKFLKKNGSKYTPEKFIIMKFLISLLALFGISKVYSLFLGIGASIAIFFLTDFLIIYDNKKDEEDILMDLSKICDSLRIQLKGGVHITNALTECYLLAKNDRLKKAFQMVETKLYMEHDLEDALVNFREMFNNKYIDTFVINILQSEKTGRVNQAMNDLAESFEDVSDSINNKKEKNTSFKVNAVIFSIVLWIIAAAGYTMLSNLIEETKNIWR